MDVEKKTPLDEVASDSEVDHGHAVVYQVSAEDERRVRWKVDMVVLPMVWKHDLNRLAQG